MSTAQNSLLRRLNPSRRGLRYGLLVAFLSLVLAPVVILTAVTLARETRIEINNALERLDFVASTQEEEMQLFTLNTANSLSGVLDDPVPRGEIFLLLERQGVQQPVQDAAAAGSSFDNQQQNFQAFTNRLIVDTGARFDRILLINADGYAIGASELNRIGTNFGDQIWFRSGIDPALAAEDGVQITEETVLFGPIGDAMATSGEQRLSYYYVVPISSPTTGEPLGMLVGRVRTQIYANLLSQDAGLGETGELILLEEELNVINQPRLAESDLGVLDSPVAVSAVAGDGVPTRWVDYRGEDVLGTSTNVESLGLTILAKQDVAEVAQAQRAVLAVNLGLGVGIALLAGLVGVFTAGQITGPLEQLTNIAARLSEGEAENDIEAELDTDVAEINQLSQAFNVMNARVNDLVQRQEAIIQDRTRQLEITAQMGRTIAAETDLERLMRVTVDMIRDRLGYYHAQVFLIDDLRQYAVLRASTGEAGQALMARNHKLAVGSQSVIGRVTESARPVLAADTDDSPVHKRNELLPDTRAELAVPLRIGDQVIGALDIQSVDADAFDEGTISVLQTVADQLAVAIRNAQLFNEREGLLTSSLQLTRMLTRESWREYAEERSTETATGYEYDLSTVRPIDEQGNGSSIVPTNGGGANGGLRMPIQVRGEEIGILEADLGESAELGEAERELVEQVLNRMALALDNARLFEQTQSSLSETARLYDASQTIADANTVSDLAERLLTLMKDVEAVDRAILYTLDDPDETAADRQILKVGAVEGETVTVEEKPPRLEANGEELRGIERAKKDGSIEKDVRAEEAARFGFTTPDVVTEAVFPLVSGGQTLAWMVLQNTRTAAAFSSDDVLFFQTVADQSATVLATARLLDQTAARARRLQAVNEVTRSTTSILNMSVLMPIVVQQVADAFGYYHVQIFRLDGPGEWAELVASTGEVGRELMRRNHRLGVGSESVIGQVTETGEIIIARDTDDAEVVHRKNELLPDTRAELAVPIKTGDRVIGALDVQSTQPNAFDEEAVLILQSLADQISVALENAELFEEIQSRVTELSTINSVSQAVSRTDTLEDLFEVVGHEMVETFSAPYGFLGLVKDGMIELPVFINEGVVAESPAPTPLGEGLTSIVIESGETLMINANAEEVAKEKGAIIVGDLPASLLIVPLIIGGETIGAVSIQSDEEYAYDDSHMRQLNTLANYIAIKIRNSELLMDTQRSANELRFLFNMTRAAVQTTDVDEALQSVANLIQAELEGAETSAVYLRERGPNDTELMVPHAATGYAAEQLQEAPITEGVIGRAVEVRKRIILQDARFEGGGGVLPDMRSLLVVPLFGGREVIGTIVVGSGEVGVFGDTDAELLEAASGTLSAVIQNAQLLEQIEANNEELRQADQLKTQFLANMSHELRTPLNSIIGFSKVILNEIDGPLTDLQRQDLSTIHESGKHLLGLINDILDMSKIEAGKMEVHNEFMELEDIVKGVMSTSLALVKDKPVRLVEDVPTRLPIAYADSKRVRQVLLNLMSNAAKFTHEGDIVLKIREYNSDPEHNMDVPHVRISVVDSGIGISEEDMPLLFEAFRQVDGSTTRQVGGTGLGLPITKEFIELMGGYIWVDSEVGQGSTFSFTLPTQPPTGVETTPTGQLIDRSKPVILAVDDEPRVLDLYRKYLDTDDYSMVGIESAYNIIDRVRSVRPSLIIMDLRLPDKDGWEALDEIQQTPDISHIPVIICSIDDEQAKGVEMGVAGYLTKPVIEDDLLTMIDNVLESTDIGQQTLATTMHEPVYNPDEMAAYNQKTEAAEMAEAIAESRGEDLDDPQPVPDEVTADEPTGDEFGAAVPSGPTSAPAVPREGEPIKTLIIDPDPDYAAALADLLADTEMFDTKVATKGFAGLGAADQQRPHVIILDVDIEDMDGLGLLAAMRSNPSTKNVPVIILTERELTEEQLDPFADGITAYINKMDHDADSLLMELDEVVAILLFGFE